MPGMVPEDVFELTGVSDPRVSPDGTRVAYVVRSIDRDANSYKSAIWLARADGSTPPRRFTEGSKRDASPRWSPDGRFLAFTSNREGDHAQLYVIPDGGGEARKLTDLKEDVTAPAWSPDGAHIAFTARVPDPAYEEEDAARRAPRRFTRLQFKLDDVGWTGDRRQHLFTVSVDGSNPPKQLTHGDFEDSDPCWSPDGSRIAFASAREDDWDRSLARDLYVIDEGGTIEKLTKTNGTVDRPAWSPDGSRIAYLFYPAVFDDPRHSQVAVLDVATRAARIVTDALDRNCAPYPTPREPIWDGDDVLFVVEDHGNTPLYRVPADGSGEPRLVEGSDMCLAGYDSAGGVIARALSEPTTLDELAVGRRRLTDVGAAFLQTRELSSPERFSAISRDGSEVEAWMMRPVGFVPGERYPTLLNIHGGPFSQYGNHFLDEFQVYAGAGYAVLYANPRGSSGYSEAWGRAIRGPLTGDAPGWGTVDYEDLMAVVDEAVRRFDFIDPERLGVMGGSYGGYMTSWIVSHSDRFRAACSERSANNFMLEGGSADLGWAFKGEFGAFWFEAPDAYLAVSPSTYAPNITTPLLVLHSENDLRCPIGHAEDLFTILRLLGRDVELVRFPEESHELSRSGSPIHRVQRFEIILEWFDRYLKQT